MSLRLLGVLLLAAVAAVIPSRSGRAAKRPKYEAVEVTDPGAGLAADFAVKEQAGKQKAPLKLGELVKAERDAGGDKFESHFRLCLKVLGEGDKASFAQAEIHVDKYSNHKLLKWAAKSSCGGK